MRRVQTSYWSVVALLLVAGCRGRPPSVFVGESEHFRLYVDPELTPLPPELEGENALAALETHWSDVATMLKMPDGKVTYHWLTEEHVSLACGDVPKGGCEWDDRLEVAASRLVEPHELIHAYMAMRTSRRPVSLLVEGIAEAIGCDLQEPDVVEPGLPWQDLVVTLPPSVDVENQGGRFVRHLLRTAGIEAFLRYYDQAPEERDPALFAGNFAAFWNTSLDEVWDAAQTRTIGMADYKICPCSLPPLPATGPIATDRARVPYWSWPDTGGMSLAATAPAGNFVVLRDCAGVELPIRGTTVVAKLETAAPWFMLPPLAEAKVGPFLSENCTEGAPYLLPAHFPNTLGWIEVAFMRPPAAKRTAYLGIALPIPMQLRRASSVEEICVGCDQGACQPLTPGAILPLEGSFFARVYAYSSGPFPSQVATAHIELRR